MQDYQRDGWMQDKYVTNVISSLLILIIRKGQRGGQAL